MLKIGITGNIGSGKTLICTIFKHLGISVFNADEEAKKIITNNNDVKEKLILILGKDSYSAEGVPDKKYIANQIFNDKNKLQQMNDIVHPATVKLFSDWVKMQTSQYVILESAILFESNVKDITDKIIVVSAPEPLRIKRVAERDGLSMEQIKERMNNQLDEKIKIAQADFVIKNDEQELLLPQVINIHDTLLKY